MPQGFKKAIEGKADTITKLQDAMRWLVGEAGLFVTFDNRTGRRRVWEHVPKDHDGNELSLPDGEIVKMPVCRLPGADGTLRLEDVGQGLEWLAKIPNSIVEISSDTRTEGMRCTVGIYGSWLGEDDNGLSPGSNGNAGSLPEALASALKALHGAWLREQACAG